MKNEPRDNVFEADVNTTATGNHGLHNFVTVDADASNYSGRTEQETPRLSKEWARL